MALAATISLFAQAGTAGHDFRFVRGGTTVNFSNPATGFSRVLKTNDQAIYSVPALLPGIYTIKVEATGFQSQSQGNVEQQIG